MKTNHFIKEIKSMGFEVKVHDVVTVIIDDNEALIAVVSKVDYAGLATDYIGFHRLDYNTKLRLLNLLIKYAKTPIEDREEEEKYYYKLKGFQDSEYNAYLNYCTESSVIFISNDEREYYTYKSQFTEAEFEALPDDIKSHNWEKIKVDREWSEMD